MGRDVEKRSIREMIAAVTKSQWTALLLLGLLLVILSLPAQKKEKEAMIKNPLLFETQEDAEEEKTVQERKLEALLQCMEGVGRVQVMLVTDAQESDDFYKKDSSRVTGACIVAEGGGNSVVIRDIKEAVMALFQIEAHKIKIMKMK